MSSQQAVPPSIFVTVVAWVFIVISGLGTVMTAAQNVMLLTMPSIQPPPDSSFLVQHIRLLFLLPLVVSALMFVSAVGLLKRLEWARKTFIGLLSVGVLYSAVSLLFVWLAGFDVPPAPDGAPTEFQTSAQEFESMFLGMRIFTTLFALIISGLLIWIIHKLVQPSISQEFAA